MRGMKSNLLIPFAVILLIIISINLFAFNYFVKDYINDGIKEQLIYTATGSKVLIKKEIAEVVFETDTTKITSVLQELNRILRSAKTNLNIELMLYSESGEMIYPVDYSGSFLNETIITGIRDILPDLDDSITTTIDTEAGRAAVIGYRLTDLPISNIPYVVFASSLDVTSSVLTAITKLMILVLLAGGVISIGLTVRIASRVVDPVKDLCDATRQIGERKVFTLSHRSNIKEIEQLTDSITDMAARIESYDNAQKAFLQNASHELRTPLMSIQGYAEGIEKGMFPDTAKAGAIISEESRKLNRLLTELLMLSRIENMNYDIVLEPAVLNEFIKEYAHTLEGLALKSGRHIRLEVCSENLMIMYNETLFGQCLMNVAGNAIRYCSDEVVITVSREGGHAVITVEDDGNGLNPKDIPHVFERFYKGANGQFGLGLAIAKTAIESMSGDIRAENGSKGAVFYIRIPLLPGN
ncbi:MAG: sensor histidine kinase [Saccharofermentanales bacterium]